MYAYYVARLPTYLDDNTLWGLCVVDLLLYLLILILRAVARVTAMLDAILGISCDGHRSGFYRRKETIISKAITGQRDGKVMETTNLPKLMLKNVANLNPCITYMYGKENNVHESHLL